MTEETSKVGNKIVCECGYCSELINQYDNRGRAVRFKDGHQNRGKNNGNYGKRGTETAAYGIRHSYETKMIMRAKRKLQIMPNGESSSRWNGGITVNSNGYVWIKLPDNHFTNSQGYVPYHRFVYESYHRCCLLSYTDIHHIDHNPRNNFPNNLFAISHSEHHHVYHNDGGNSPG
jgi:hypothetical protein